MDWRRASQCDQVFSNRPAVKDRNVPYGSLGRLDRQLAARYLQPF